MKRVAILLMGLAACAEPSNGTFVGNPGLTARYVDNADQVGLGGSLVTLATAIEPCDSPTIGLGPRTFVFEGNSAVIDVELPQESLCGMRIVVQRLTIRATDHGVDKTVTGQDFDLWVPADAFVDGAEALELRLADASWLPSFLPLAPAGETLLTGDAPDLEDAFYEGLMFNSAFQNE